MTKKLIIYIIIFTLIVTIIILLALYTDTISLIIFVIPLGILGFIILIFNNLFLPYRKKIMNENIDLISNSSYNEINTSLAKIISLRNGFSTILLPKSDYYFDTHYFYELSANRVIKIKLQDILKINKDSLSINNRNVWYVTANLNGEIRTFRFLHNYTLWNKNFPEFISAVKTANPNAEILKMSIWNI